MKKRISYTVLVKVLEPHEAAMVEAYLAGDYIKSFDEQKRCHDLMSASGWTEKEFNDEMLRRIDLGWDIITPPPRGNHPVKLASRFGGIAGLPHCKVLH
jgi:hypothetical protein